MYIVPFDCSNSTAESYCLYGGKPGEVDISSMNDEVSGRQNKRPSSDEASIDGNRIVPPKHLYKYRAINEFTERLITQQEIYAAAPKEFNDPFEAKPVFEMDLNSPAGKEWFMDRAKRHGIKNPSKRLQLFREAQRRFEVKPVTTESAGFQNLYDSGIGIYCLTEEKANLLMWPHYADSHRGICLEFETALWPFNLAFPVRYSDEYPRINRAVESAYETLNKSLLTKSTCWSYEREWRIIMRNPSEQQLRSLGERSDDHARWTRAQHGPGIYNFPREALTKVIFGLRSGAAEKDKVRAWIAKAGLTIRFAEAQQDQERFEIHVVDL